MSDGAWLEADEVGFEHHPDIPDWMLERGCGRARVVLAAQVGGHRWTLLQCGPGEPDDPEPAPEAGFLALALGDEALLEGDPRWEESLRRLREGSQSR